MKTCKDCGLEKPIDSFSPHTSTKDRLSNICKPCNSIRVRSYQKENLEKYRNNNHNQGIRKHGISISQYETILANQNGVCAVCGENDGDKRLSIDHDHRCCQGKYSCGKCIRGLLCTRCNFIVGHLESNKTLSTLIDEYVSRYN